MAFPTDARLMHKAIVMLARLAKKHDVPLRQSYVRVTKRAALMAGRYAHAKQYKRHNREIKFLRTRLGRLIRDIRRQTEGDAALEAVFTGALIPRRSGAPPAPAATRLEALFASCARGRVHW